MTPAPDCEFSVPALQRAIARMDGCRAGCEIGEPFYADAYAWDIIRAELMRAQPLAAPCEPTAGDYVADREVEPRSVTFADGRIVRVVGDGYLEVERA